MQLDGSHTPAKQGGEAIDYQSRKTARTTNALFFTDKKGQPIVMAEPQADNHHDVYEIRTLFKQIPDERDKLCILLEEAGISLNGVFMNADAGFDRQKLRTLCSEREIEANIANNPLSSDDLSETCAYIDDELYNDRNVIERTNAWLDSFKGLLIRFEKKIKSWMA